MLAEISVILNATPPRGSYKAPWRRGVALCAMSIRVSGAADLGSIDCMRLPSRQRGDELYRLSGQMLAFEARRLHLIADRLHGAYTAESGSFLPPHKVAGMIAGEIDRSVR